MNPKILKWLCGLLIAIFIMYAVIFFGTRGIFLLIYTISIVVGTWAILHHHYYDDKSQIRRLWRIVYDCAEWQEKFKKAGVNEILLIGAQKKADKAGTLINAILDNNFSESEDEEMTKFVSENKYKRLR